MEELIQRLRADNLTVDDRVTIEAMLRSVNLRRTTDDMAGDGYITQLDARNEAEEIVALSLAVHNPEPDFVTRLDALTSEFYG
ncbi:hypothetical protein [Deinococcus kurensis]|uniref:hypothetical protein n=1 Tax=Deinococcus kurensis TaxID=2662757 RepID=UPI0012D2B847|nr:hypothetical protein [Deinococcus kurensis]